MNTAVRAITSRSLTWWALPLTITRQHIVAFGLALMVLLSAFSVVYVKDMNRRLMSQLQSAQMNNVQQHNQWTQLVLQKSTLANQAHVAQLAHKEFHMTVPAPGSVVIVNAK